MSKAKGTIPGAGTTSRTGTTNTTGGTNNTGTSKTNNNSEGDPESGGGGPFFGRMATSTTDLPIRFYTGDPKQARVDLAQMRDFRYEHVPPDEVAAWLAPYRHDLMHSGSALLNPDSELHIAEGSRLSYFRISWEGPKEPAAGRDIRFRGHPYHFNGDGSVTSIVYQGSDWPEPWRQNVETARLIMNGASSKNPNDPRDYQELVVCYQDAQTPINPMHGESTHCVPVTTFYLSNGEQAELRVGQEMLWITLRNREISLLWPSGEFGTARETTMLVEEWAQRQEKLRRVGCVITFSMLSGIPVGRLLTKSGRDDDQLTLCLNSGVTVLKR